MAQKANQRANGSKEKMSARVRRAYRQGYKQGFEDSAKSVNGSRFWGSRGYSRGYGDKNKIRKIEKRYNRYKNS